MTSHPLCDANIEVARQVYEFMAHVPSANEESVTDFLLWKWRELDKAFNYLSADPFTKKEESKTTGADFELELWLVGRTIRLPLLIQAKKIVKPYNSYRTKLRYPKSSNDQIRKLFRYARRNNRIPAYLYYMFPYGRPYSAFDKSKVRPNPLILAHAATTFRFTRMSQGSVISKSDLRSSGIGFHKLFCPCGVRPGERLGLEYRFDEDLSRIVRDVAEERIPEYLNPLLLPEQFESGYPAELRRHIPSTVRNIAVYDLRKHDLDL